MKHRYSFLIKPLQLFIDCVIIVLVVLYLNDREFLNTLFLSYVISFWIISSLFTKYYSVHRYTKLFRVLTLTFRHFLVFLFGFFAFFGIFKEGLVVNNQLEILLYIFSLAILFKFGSFFLLRLYRTLGRNYRKVVVLGHNHSTKRVSKFFNARSSMGYQLLGYFTDKKVSTKLGAIKDCYDFILEREVDEIYCSMEELDKEIIKSVTIFANTNDIVVKLIPESERIYSKSRKAQYYDDALAILNVEKLPFEKKENLVVKRIFDFFFAAFICLTIMIWLVPILWVLIKLESKGPAIFKQKREGLNGHQFVCFKFRSMRLNKMSDHVHATENDSRVTKIGSFIRKTSIDELPQFFNVLKGDMSVVGPRPHLKTLSLEYQKDVENYLKRHSVKPGITGLAQVSGYRGEVKKKSDIKNRVRLDIFYIENWSFLLDVKIILMTVFNVFKGEEKAY